MLMDADGTAFREARQVFRDCDALAIGHGEPLLAVAQQLRQTLGRLDQPMRLAVIGQIKRGKSTLVNALLGESVAATGQLELTFTVSEFCYGYDRLVYVHYKDGTSQGPLPPSALDSMTIRNPAKLDQLRKIRTVEYTMPNGLLRTFRLIDTPGLGSIYGLDSQNTSELIGVPATFVAELELAAMGEALAAMGRTGSDMHSDSVAEIQGADAVLYLFDRALHESDYETVEQFLGAARGSVTPLRAFGVLSRCDQYWPPDPYLPGNPDPLSYDPMRVAADITGRYMDQPAIQRLFLTVAPVAGLVGIGACLLTQEELGWLDELRRAVEPPLLAKRLRDTGRFATAATLADVPLPAAMRSQLIGRLGTWGIHLACRYLRDGLGPDEVRKHLVADSGVLRLRELITGHFGTRASVIKLEHGLQEVAAEIWQCRLAIRRADQETPQELNTIASEVERLRVSERSPSELAVLTALYNNKLTLSPDEVHQIRLVTGERGTSFAARLGMPNDTPLPDLAAIADQLAARWAAREHDPTLDRASIRAARTIRRSYDRLVRQIAEARQTEQTEESDEDPADQAHPDPDEPT
jgi:GTPase SAR1 family protein